VNDPSVLVRYRQRERSSALDHVALCQLRGALAGALSQVGSHMARAEVGWTPRATVPASREEGGIEDNAK
jgi:hypothetical protein